MVKDRISLHNILVNILGTKNVYFQPPPTIKMNYPCIIYKLDGVDSKKADNKNYMTSKLYSITLVDHNPDTPFLDKLLELQYSSFDNMLVFDNLNHYMISLYY